MAFKDRYFQ